LNQYYDEAFKEDSRSVDDLCINYKDDSARLQREIASVISTPSKFLDVEKLKKEKELLDLRFTMNLQRLTLKKKEPSQVVELQSTSDVLSTIGTLVDDANALNTEHNKMLENLAHERSHLTEQVWKLKKDLLNYDSLRNGLNKAIADVKVQIQCVLTSQQAKVAEIKALERSTTSIQPTIDAINALLISVGFDSFSLATANNKTGCYKLIRMDGSDAKETLSEGESSFLSLLYFFHLLKGSNTESGMTTDRVAVFDDPVSSLDNDILLIVGALMKELYDEIQTGKGNIKQIFILTHNMSFYKEVTFNPDNLHFKRNESTFWTVKKNGLKSKIQKLSSNHL
jgi:wobble nucleotide-excising tRNase